MATFYNDAINQDARNVLQKKVGALTSNPGKRDIPSGLVGSFYNNEISLEDLTSKITGTPNYDPTKGPQINYGSGPQPLTQAQTQALAGGQSITDVANIGRTISQVTPNDIQNGAKSSYTVQAGDTLGAIASRMGVPISSISGYKSGDINKIGVGEVLTIGGKGTSAIDPKAIPTNTIVPTTPIGVTTPTTTTPSTAGAYGDTVTKTLDQYIKEAQSATKSATEIKQDALTSRLSQLLDQTSGQAQALSTAEAEQGVPDLTKQLQDINNQIKTTRAEQNALNVDVQGKPITMSSIIGAQAQINAVMDSKIYTLSAQAQALQGNISLAKENAQKAVDLKYAPIIEELKIKQAQLELIQPTLTKEEKIRAEALAQKNKDEANALQIQIANKKDQNSTLLNLMQSYPDARITLSDTIESANTKITNNSAIYKEKIKTTGSGTGGETNFAGTVPSEFSGIADSAAGLVASTKTKATKNNINSALASGNYVNAYAEIANAVEDGLTGSSKTKFADARTDIGVLSGMRNAIAQYAAAGGDMGLLQGTEESIKRKLGIDSGKATVLATSLWREFQTYRSNMTGAAFTEKESRDYASVNPTLGKSLDLNLNVIDGAISQLNNRITSTVDARVPDAKKVYEKINGSKSVSSEQKIVDFGIKNPAYQGIIAKASNDISNPEDLLQFLRSVLPSPLLTQLQ